MLQSLPCSHGNTLPRFPAAGSPSVGTFQGPFLTPPHPLNSACGFLVCSDCYFCSVLFNFQLSSHHLQTLLSTAAVPLCAAETDRCLYTSYNCPIHHNHKTTVSCRKYAASRGLAALASLPCLRLTQCSFPLANTPFLNAVLPLSISKLCSRDNFNFS